MSWDNRYEKEKTASGLSSLLPHAEHIIRGVIDNGAHAVSTFLDHALHPFHTRWDAGHSDQGMANVVKDINTHYDIMDGNSVGSPARAQAIVDAQGEYASHRSTAVDVPGATADAALAVGAGTLMKKIKDKITGN